MLIISLTSWAWSARLLRAQTMSLAGRDFVEAARASGEPAWRIVVFELLPNLTAIIASGFIVTVIFTMTTEIALASSAPGQCPSGTLGHHAHVLGPEPGAIGQRLVVVRARPAWSSRCSAPAWPC